jgi:hypothetical protein
MKPTIPTVSLRLEDIPAAKARLPMIEAFALMFDIHEMDPGYGEKANDLRSASTGSSLIELRAHLYIEQRRWNHFGGPQDTETEMRLREVVGWIRDKVASRT